MLLTSGSHAENLRQGLDYYKSGEYKKAEIFFRKITIEYPYDYSARYLLAVSLVNLQKYNEAKELYREIIKNSQNERLVSLSQTGLRNIGGSPVYSGNRSINKAVININTTGSVMIINNVLLNDRLKTKFVFDTGATYTTISKAAASSLNISTRGAPQIRVMTGSGHITAPLVKVDKMEVKGLIAKNVDVLIADLPIHTDESNSSITGLLGLSFLKDFKVTVDRSKGQITLEKN